MSTPSFVSSLTIATGIKQVIQILDSTNYVWILVWGTDSSTGSAASLVYQYEKSSGTVISSTVIREGSYAASMCINPSETIIYVLVWYYYEIVSINITSSPITTSSYNLPNGSPTNGHYGYIATDGTSVYSLSPWANIVAQVSAVDISNNVTTDVTNITLPLTGGNNNYFMTYDSVNSCIWVGNSSNTISKIVDTTITTPITVTNTSSDTPACIVTDGTYLWFGCAGTTYQVDISSGSTIKSYTSYVSNNNAIYSDSNGQYTWIIDQLTTSFIEVNVSEQQQTSNTIVNCDIMTGDTDYIYVSGSDLLYVYLKNEPVCYNENTKILSLVNEEEVYVPIQDLRKGDLIKTYLHGYKKINLIGKGSFINNVNKPATCMYKLEKTEQNNLTDDLIVTGKHSILVDNIPTSTLNTHFDGNLNNVQKIDNKFLIHSSICKLFDKIEDSDKYTYYHLVLENDDESENTRYGIWANGILSETTCLKDFKDSNLNIIE